MTGAGEPISGAQSRWRKSASQLMAAVGGAWDGCCGKCGSETSSGNVWYGTLPNKYCKKPTCLAVGRERGHVTTRGQKRARSPGESSQPETVATDEEITLVSIDRIYQFRYAPCLPALRAC